MCHCAPAVSSLNLKLLRALALSHGWLTPPSTRSDFPRADSRSRNLSCISSSFQAAHKEMSEERKRRDRSNSVSSKASSTSRKPFNFGRSRGFSRSSHRSAVSIASSSSRDSGIDAQRDDEVDSHSSGGNETDEDVCFPMYDEQDVGSQLKIEELDQLLQLSDDDSEQNESALLIDPPPSKGTGSTLVVPQPPAAPDLGEHIQTPGDLRVGFIPQSHNLKKKMDDNDNDNDTEDVRFSFFATKLDQTVHSSDLASLVGQNESFSSLFTATNGTWWLDCYDPTDQEVKILSRAFGIHPLTSEDIRTEDSREKFELFQKYYFVSFHTFGNNPDNEEYYLEPINFYVIVFADGVLSFHFTPVSHCRNVRRRMRQLREYVTVTSDWICYALVDDITDSFAPLIHEVEAETDYIEDHVYAQGHEQDMRTILQRLAETRKTAMALIRLLTGKADVIKGFEKRCNETWGKNAPSQEIALYLGDIQDHIITMYQNLVAYEKILSRSHVNYMAQLQMEFVNSSNRMTTVLGKATLIGTVLVPMNLITGLFGMNVQVPGQNVENLTWWFSILGFVILMVVFLGTAANYWVNRVNR